MAEGNARERQAAARIVRKHLCRLFVKAITKGYDLTMFDRFYVGSGNMPPENDYAAPMTIVRIQGDNQASTLCINTGHLTNDVSSTSGQFRDISSTPELFSQARKVLDRIDAIIDALPKQPRRFLSIDNLAKLQDLYREVETTAGDNGKNLFHSHVMAHTINGLKTAYAIDMELVSAEGIKTGSVNIRGTSFSDCAGTAINILNDIEKQGTVGIGYVEKEILAFCSNALLVMPENKLLVELDRNAGAGECASVMEDSLRQDMEEVFPGVPDLEARYGARINRLLKNKQIELFRPMQGRSTHSMPEEDFSRELPGVKAAIDVTLDVVLKDMKGPFRSWEAVRQTMTDPAVGALSTVEFHIPLGSEDSSSIKCCSFYSSRDALMRCLFVALNRAVEGGGHVHPDVIAAYIRCVSRGVAEAATNTFTSSLAEDRRQNILNVVKNEAENKNPGKTYALADHKGSIDSFAHVLSETVSELRDLYKLDGSCLDIESAKHFPLSDGWYCSAYFDQYDLRLHSVKLAHMEKDATPPEDKYARVYHPSIDFNTAASQVVLSRKITEAVENHMDKEHVWKLLDFFADNTRVKNLKEDISGFINAVRRKSTDVEERYYKVLQNDFPEDFMEEYVAGVQNI